MSETRNIANAPLGLSPRFNSNAFATAPCHDRSSRMSLKQSHVLIWFLPLVVLAVLIALEVAGVGNIALSVREWVRGDLGRFIPRPSFADRVELVFTAGVGMGIVILLAQRELFKAGIVAVCAILAAILISWRSEVDGRIFLDAAYPSLVIASVFTLGRVMHVLHLSARRETIRRALASRLTPAAAAAVARRPKTLKITGQTRDITYLVCRLRGFSSLADAKDLDAEGAAAFLRKVMTPLRQAVLEKGGMIDHVAPGRLTAFFNAPLEDSDHVASACECALGMIEQLENINGALEKALHAGGAPIAPVQMEIGIECGPSLVGNFGTEDWPEYSASGRIVEVAEEIGSLCAKYGPAIIVGDEVRAAAEERFAFLEVDLLPAGPNGAAVPIFALLGNALVRASPKFRALQTFHEHIFRTYRARQWKKNLRAYRTMPRAVEPKPNSLRSLS